MRLWEMQETMSYVSLGRFAPINQEGDRIDLECKDHGQMRSLT